MGEVIETITLQNAGDLTLFQRGYIPESAIRRVTLKATVDTGAITSLVIDEETRERLGLGIEGVRESATVGGHKVLCRVSEAVRIQWQDRWTTGNAWVTTTKKTLLGVIALENMDLMVNPVARCLVGVHGDQPMGEIS